MLWIVSLCKNFCLSQHVGYYCGSISLKNSIWLLQTKRCGCSFAYRAGKWQLITSGHSTDVGILWCQVWNDILVIRKTRTRIETRCVQPLSHCIGFRGCFRKHTWWHEVIIKFPGSQHVSIMESCHSGWAKLELIQFISVTIRTLIKKGWQRMVFVLMCIVSV